MIRTLLAGSGSLARSVAEAASPLLKLTFLGAQAETQDLLRTHNTVIASGYLTIADALAAGATVLAWYGNPLREDYLRLHPAAQSILICGNDL